MGAKGFNFVLPSTQLFSNHIYKQAGILIVCNTLIYVTNTITCTPHCVLVQWTTSSRFLITQSGQSSDKEKKVNIHYSIVMSPSNHNTKEKLPLIIF